MASHHNNVLLKSASVLMFSSVEEAKNVTAMHPPFPFIAHSLLYEKKTRYLLWWVLMHLLLLVTLEAGQL